MKILVILGHPAKNRHSFCEVLCDAYIEGARNSGHDVMPYKIAEQQYALLCEGYVDIPPAEPSIERARAQITWADHIVFVYPLWTFMIPAQLKGLLERVLIMNEQSSDPRKKLLPLRGKTVRLIQTSGMPGFFYRFYYMAHGAKALRDILKFCGVRRVRASYFGMFEGDAAAKKRQKIIELTRQLGARGD